MRDHAEIKSTEYGKQLLMRVGWYREKAKMIFRFSSGYPERDCKLRELTQDNTEKM